MNEYKYGIYGIGMVGGALQGYFKNRPNCRLYLYDKYKKIGSIAKKAHKPFVVIL